MLLYYKHIRPKHGTAVLNTAVVLLVFKVRFSLSISISRAEFEPSSTSQDNVQREAKSTIFEDCKGTPEFSSWS